MIPTKRETSIPFDVAADELAASRRGAWRRRFKKGHETGANFLTAALIAALALGYLLGRGSLTFEAALNETPFPDVKSFSSLDWSIEDFELKFEKQYTALIRTINDQTNWEIARRGPYRQWLAAQGLPDSPAAQAQFKLEFDERLKSNRDEWRKLLENTVSNLRESFALRRAELDLLAFYGRHGMTNEFIAFYEDLTSKPNPPPGLGSFSRQYAALFAQGAVSGARLARHEAIPPEKKRTMPAGEAF